MLFVFVAARLLCCFGTDELPYYVLIVGVYFIEDFSERKQF